MSILVDFSQIILSNLFANLHYLDTEINEDLLRHMTLNSLRHYRSKFRHKFGDLVLCVDDKQYWRRDVFPNYKAGRRKERETSKYDWHLIFESLNKIKNEIATFLPYRVLDVPRAEADDLIGVICKFYHTSEPFLILSGDHDFIQLQKFPNVTQYAPIQKKYLSSDNPQETLHEHIMLGDQGDGVPNFLSPDDTFVSGKRQSPIHKEKLARWVKEPNPENFCDTRMLRGYKRNQQLIDLDMIPKEIKDAIIEEWDKPFTPSRKHLLDYFVQHRLSNLLDVLSEF